MFVPVHLFQLSEYQFSSAGFIKEQLARLEQSANTMVDSGLRMATLKMIRLVASHDPSKSSVILEEGVYEIYRASWVVYANFVGVRETYSSREVEKARGIITQVYEVALRKTSWISDQKVASQKLVLARTDLKKKADFFKETK